MTAEFWAFWNQYDLKSVNSKPLRRFKLTVNCSRKVRCILTQVNHRSFRFNHFYDTNRSQKNSKWLRNFR